MLRTSSGERPPGAGLGGAGGLADSAAATMPGARFARGTRRGKPAWVTRSAGPGRGGPGDWGGAGGGGPADSGGTGGGGPADGGGVGASATGTGGGW
jgi:hypothetical protein